MESTFRFEENSGYSLRGGKWIQRQKNATMLCVVLSLNSLGTKTWKQIPTDLKNSEKFQLFKQRIKQRAAKNCLCKICKKLFQNIV